MLLADADVLIDYRDSDLEVVGLIGQHVGPVSVLSPVLDEVRGLSQADCEQLSIPVVMVATRRLLKAASIDSSVRPLSGPRLISRTAGRGRFRRPRH